MSNSRNRDHLQVTLAQFISYAESNSGYCTTCESFTVPSGIEFDSLGDDCGRCGRSVVVGLQVAYDLGYFEIREWDEAPHFHLAPDFAMSASDFYDDVDRAIDGMYAAAYGMVRA